MDRQYKYVVATRCFTYNHASYIGDALRGFVKQENSIPVVYIIVDDASKDGAQDVLRKWVAENLECEENKQVWQKKEYGEIAVALLKDRPYSTFVILLLRENHYQTGRTELMEQYVSEWERNAKYLAICEGDDYWIDPRKLQLQYDFLDNNREYSLCYTSYNVYDEGQKKVIGTYGVDYRDVWQMLWKDVNIATASVFFRQELYDDYIKEIGNPSQHGWLMGDKPLFFYLGHRGYTKLLPEVTSVYRKVATSASHSSDINLQLKRARNTIDIYHYFADMYFPNNITLSKRIEGGYLYRAYCFHRTMKVKYPEELKSAIFHYKGTYYKVHLVKIMLLFPCVERFVYGMTALKDRIIARTKKSNV